MRFRPRLRKKRPPPDELDRIILRQLQGAGVDLTRPRHVLHFVYFASEADAREAAAAAESAGYEVAVTEPSEEIEQWGVRAESTRVVDYTTVAGFRSFFERIAEEHGGEYDGWEAASEP
jgi:Regulator of ribonuclease activity B